MTDNNSREGRDEVRLSTGRRIYANCGLIGINAAGELSEGYDDGIDTRDFTVAERQELAARMIDLWTAWAAKGTTP